MAGAADNQPRETPGVLPAVDRPTLLLAGFFVALLCLLGLVVSRKTHSKRNLLLLVGHQDAGKTSILSRLVYGQSLQTHSSLQTNSSSFILHSTKKSVRVIDIPGHRRIRDQFLEHISDARAIAFVVDTSTVSRNGPAVAEHLHSVLYALCSLPPSQPIPQLLILAHKTDLLSSTTAAYSNASINSLATNRVRTILERELDKRRRAQSGRVGMEDLDGDAEKSEMGGLDCGNGASFTFEEWDGGEIRFLSTSSMGKSAASTDDEKEGGSEGLASLREWLEQNV